MILTLITLGKYMETRSKGKTSEAIEKLINLAPKTAIRLNGDTEEEIPVKAVRAGDILLIRPGTEYPCRRHSNFRLLGRRMRLRLPAKVFLLKNANA